MTGALIMSSATIQQVGDGVRIETMGEVRASSMTASTGTFKAVIGSTGTFLVVDSSTVEAHYVHAGTGTFDNLQFAAASVAVLTVSTLTVTEEILVSEVFTDSLSVTNRISLTGRLTGGELRPNQYYQNGVRSVVLPPYMIVLSTTGCPAPLTDVTVNGFYMVAQNAGPGNTVGTAMADGSNAVHNHGLTPEGTGSPANSGGINDVPRGDIAPYIQVSWCAWIP